MKIYTVDLIPSK